MMKKYGTPATEGDIQRAQFLNYLKAPKPLQQAMQQYGHDSDAYRGIQNSMASAQEDIGIRQGTPEPARAWLASQQSPQGQVQAADLVQRTVGGLGPSHPLTQMLNPQAEAERVARRQAARAEQTPVNARGVAGATYGNVNGVNQLVPQAGHYQEFQGAMAAEGLNGQMGVDRGRFEQNRSARVRQQEASRRQVKLESKQAGDLAFERQKELAGLKDGANGRRSGDTVDEAGQKQGQRAFYDDRRAWKEMQAQGSQYDRLAREAAAQGLLDDDLITTPDGKQVKVWELRSSAQSLLSSPEPTWEEYGIKGPTRLGGSPDIGNAGGRAAIGAGGTVTRKPGSPAVKPSPAAPAVVKTFKSGYTSDQLAGIADRATAIERLRGAGDEDAARYLEGLQ